MDSEEEGLVGLGYGDEEGMEGLEEEGQDQEVPEAPSPPEEESREDEVFQTRLEHQIDGEMMNRLGGEEDIEDSPEEGDQGTERISEPTPTNPEEDSPVTEDSEDVAGSPSNMVPEVTQSELESEADTVPETDNGPEEEIEVPVMDVDKDNNEDVALTDKSACETSPEDTATTESHSDETAAQENCENLLESEKKDTKKDEVEMVDSNNSEKLCEVKTPAVVETKQEAIKKHPGVFEMSEDTTKETDDEAKEILDSLPVLERLRGVSRAGSVRDTIRNKALYFHVQIRDDASQSTARSEAGDAASDSCSAAPPARGLRRKEAKKPTKKGTASSVKTKNGGVGKTTRSTRGKGRRSLAKHKPVKAPNTQPTVVTSNKIYFEVNHFSTIRPSPTTPTGPVPASGGHCVGHR